MRNDWRPNAFKFLEKARRDMQRVTLEQAVYLAGIVDGEGNIGLYKNKNRKSSPSCFAYVGIGNTNTKLMDWLRAALPWGTFTTQVRDNPKWKNPWTAQWTGARAIAILEVISPWLVLKEAQAEEVMALYCAERAYLEPLGRSQYTTRCPVPSWIVAQRDWALTNIREMNRKGKLVA